MALHVMDEANQCLGCKKPRCQQGCPIQTNIPEVIRLLKANKRGLFVTDEVGHTSRPGLFASGDAVKGARTVVEAVAYSKKVAEAMHEYMQTLPPDLPDEYANVPVAQNDDGN